MDDFTSRWPYRCLPLDIANQAGWEILCPVTLDVTWSGAAEASSLRVEYGANAERWQTTITTHFGHGVLTFWLPWLLRTRAPTGLLVRGACNFWIDGAVPLDAYVETWGLEAPFTMNWKVTAVNRTVRFEAGQPICLVLPYDLGTIESARPAVRSIEENPALCDAYTRWKDARMAFMDDRRATDSQNTYTKGLNADSAAVEGHRTRVAVRPFDDPPMSAKA